MSDADTIEAVTWFVEQAAALASELDAALAIVNEFRAGRLQGADAPAAFERAKKHAAAARVGLDRCDALLAAHPMAELLFFKLGGKEPTVMLTGARAFLEQLELAFAQVSAVFKPPRRGGPGKA